MPVTIPNDVIIEEVTTPTPTSQPKRKPSFDHLYWSGSNNNKQVAEQHYQQMVTTESYQQMPVTMEPVAGS